MDVDACDACGFVALNLLFPPSGYLSDVFFSTDLVAYVGKKASALEDWCAYMKQVGP